MGAYREKLDKGLCKRSSKFTKWAKRQMSKIRRRWPKGDVPPPTAKLTNGYYS